MAKKSNAGELDKLLTESTTKRKDCNLCNEIDFAVGKNTGYGVIVYKIGDAKSGWFATLSPKTGGDPTYDFTIQLMPYPHLTHFSQMISNSKLAQNYGVAFSKICKAAAAMMMGDQNLKATSGKRELAVSLATYGKCTTWKEKKEHLHIKVFPFRGTIGQPYTVDSTFEKKEVFKEKNGSEYVKMLPVRKVMINKKRFEKLAKDLIDALK